MVRQELVTIGRVFFTVLMGLITFVACDPGSQTQQSDTVVPSEATAPLTATATTLPSPTATISPSPIANTPPLQGIEWTLRQLKGDSLIEGTEITLKVTAERIEGHSGCNSYFSEDAVIESGHFSFTEIARTLADCGAEILEQEAKYQSALGEAVAYSVVDDQLKFYNVGRDVVLNFTRRTLPLSSPTPVIPESLRDTEWALVYLNGEELGEEVAFELKIEDGKVVALGECNWLRTHTDEQMPHLIITEAGEFSLGFATQSLIGCFDGVEQEEAYFLALTAVTTYELADNQLRLSTPEKPDLLIFEKR